MKPVMLCSLAWVAAAASCDRTPVPAEDNGVHISHDMGATDSGLVTDGVPIDDADPGCPPDLASAEGQPCPSSVEGKFCGGDNCSDPCQFCNILQCQGGTWQRVEVFPDPNCFTDAGPMDSGSWTCGTAICVEGEYCYTTGCGVDGGVPPPPSCEPLPAGCASCACANPWPECVCTQQPSGLIEVDCPAA